MSSALPLCSFCETKTLHWEDKRGLFDYLQPFTLFLVRPIIKFRNLSIFFNLCGNVDHIIKKKIIFNYWQVSHSFSQNKKKPFSIEFPSRIRVSPVLLTGYSISFEHLPDCSLYSFENFFFDKKMLVLTTCDLFFFQESAHFFSIQEILG